MSCPFRFNEIAQFYDWAAWNSAQEEKRLQDALNKQRDEIEKNILFGRSPFFGL